LLYSSLTTRYKRDAARLQNAKKQTQRAADGSPQIQHGKDPMRKLNIVAGALLLISFTGAASAAGEMKAACQADVEKFCKDAQKGKDRRACLQSHESELQPACSDALKARAQKNG
jgi:hypothetical protein